MLALYINLAKKLVPLRAFFIYMILALLGFIVYAFTLAPTAQYDIWLVPAALTILWLLLAYAMIQLFAFAPDLLAPNSSKQTTRLTAISLAFKRKLYQCIAFVYSVCSIALIILTLRSLNLALAH